MAIGAGKYDDLCTYVREQSEAEGGVVLIVLEGNEGNGFSAQISPDGLLKLPELLEEIAASMRQDRERFLKLKTS